MKTLSVSGKSSYLPSPARAFLTRCHFSQILFIRSESVSPAHAQKKRTEFYFLRGEILNSLCMCVQTTGILEDSRQRREKIGFQIGHRVCWYEERMFSFSPTKLETLLRSGPHLHRFPSTSNPLYRRGAP